jgi:hypothetical protein
MPRTLKNYCLEKKTTRKHSGAIFLSELAEGQSGQKISTVE